MDNFFDFGAAAEIDFEEQVCRFVILVTVGGRLMYL
jgi:hypothetical protein